MDQNNINRFKRRQIFKLLTAGGIAGSAVVTGERLSAQAAEEKSQVPLKTAKPLGAWQNNWRWCNKCQGMFYGGNGTAGACPTGGGHNWGGSGDYSLWIN